MVFSLFEATKRLVNQQDYMRVGVLEEIIHTDVVSRLSLDPLLNMLQGFKTQEIGDEEALEYVTTMDSLPLQLPIWRHVYESLVVSKEPLQPSKSQPPKSELKPLPEHLKYVYSGTETTLLVIIASKLLLILRKHQDAIRWTIADIKGINPAICMHRILLEEGVNLTIDTQHRLKLIMKEVARNEVMKLLDGGIIYLVFDSKWVNHTQVMPKRTGI